MRSRKPFARSIFYIFLFACLLTGLMGNGNDTVNAASSSIVISQVYGGGGNTGAPYTNDYVELFNLGPSTVTLDNWSIQYALATGTSWTVTSLNGVLLAGQYYLVQLGPAGANGVSLPTPDVSGANGIDTTDGKIALVNDTTALSGACPTTGVIDFIGYGSANCNETANAPAPSVTTAVIRTNTCTDGDNNSVDFVKGSPNPRNSSIPPLACLKILNVTSSTPNGIYTVGITTDTIINIDIEFSVPVNVTGSPYLLLETGASDNKATYSAGSGGTILTFKYVVATGDVSGDLDYVSKDSLVLNGGSITGAVGDAVLTLPNPGTVGSLSYNKDIKIDNQQPPAVTVNQASTQVDPAGALPINFTVVFSEPVDISTFTPVDIIQEGTATGVNWSIVDTGDQMTFTLSATVVTVPGTIIPSIAANQVADVFGNGNTASTSTDNDVLYIIDRFDVTIEQAVGQLDPTGNTPINFTVTFTKAITPSTFTVSDITQNGTATGISWNIVNADSGANRVFTLSALAVTSPGTTTLQPSIAADRISDPAGNKNNQSTSMDNTVTFDNTVAPSVTITQQVSQADPTNAFPIKFNVKFSEAIIASIFTPSDVMQGPVTGAATGVTWSIADSGDHTNFTLTATGATGAGIIFPYIAANRVTDLVGNNNIASTSSSTPENTVVFETTRPTVTVKQADGQADPTSTLPVRFTVVFSERINASTFTAADITQTGTATGVTWSITNADAGVNEKFTLSAIALTGKGTLIPSIGMNKVTDVAGNSNYPSTSTDNSVKFTGAFPTPTRTATPTRTPTPTLGVFISEVAWMGTLASSNDEWIELYNSGSADVDLSNWTLRSTNGAINITFLSTDSNHIIKSHDFFVLARAGSFTDIVIDKTITATFSNSGESLQLRNNLGVLIDTANSNGGYWPAGIASPTYATMERHNGNSLDTDVNWYTFAGTPTTYDRNGNFIKGTPGYANWALTVRATPSRTPTPTRTPYVFKTATPKPLPPPPLIAINEFVPRPGHDWNNDGAINTGDEYIELLNHGTVSANLSGYRLDDEANIGSSPYSLPSVTLEPGERIIFYGNQTGLLLSDGGDGVRLLKPNGQLMDAYNYFVVQFPDQSFCRLPDNGGADDWNTNCYPTPGLQNTLSGTILRPPMLEDENRPLCPIADTLPQGFVLAECAPFGHNIWNRYYWDKFGWYGERILPDINVKWDIFAD